MSVGDSYKYLHYWFYHSGLAIDTFDQAKKQTLLNQLQVQAQMRIPKMVTAGSDMQEAAEIIDLLTSPEANEKRRAVFDSQGGGGTRRGSGLGDLTYAQLRYRSGADIQGMIDSLANGIQDFVDQLENWIEQAYDNLCTGESFEEYKSKVIAEYIANKGLSEASQSTVANSIISDLLSGKHNGLNKLNLTTAAIANGGPLNTALRNLTLIASAIPTMTDVQVWNGKSGKSSGSVTVKGSEVLNLISGKIGGMFSNVQGTGGEIAVMKAEEAGAGEVLINAGAVLTASNVGSSNIQKTVIKDPQMDKDAADAEKVYRVSKEDVHVVVTSGGVTIEYGINIKNYAAPKGNATMGRVTLVSGTPFIEAAHKVGISNYYMLNLAAGHGSRSAEAGGLDDATLGQGWQDLVSFVVYSNFLNILAGEANSAGDNILLFIVNGNAFTIPEVLDRVSSGDMNITHSLSRNDRVLRSRAPFVAANNWITAPGQSRGARTGSARQDAAAQQRSAIAWDNAYRILSETKLTVELNMLASLMG